MPKKDSAYQLLKWALALVFLWFGLLKLFDVSPVKDLVFTATPFLKSLPYGFTILGIFEILVGAGLLWRRTAYASGILIAIHLVIASFSVLFLSAAWMPSFPFLSIPGEFVVKNAVLAAAAWMVAKTERKS